MLVLELNELRDMIKGETDSRTKGTLMVLLCIADRVSENTAAITANEKAIETHEAYVVKSQTLFTAGVWLLSGVQLLVVGLFSYIFTELNTLSYRQAGVLATLVTIEHQHQEIDTKLKDIETRNAAADNIQRQILNKEGAIP